MNIEVTDERGERDSYRTTISPMTPDDSSRVHGSYTSPIRLPYNPENYTIQLNPRWVQRNTAATSHLNHGSDWETTEPRQLSISSLTLQPEDPEECDHIATSLELWAGRPTLVTGEPTRVTVQMGRKLILGHIDHFNYTAVHTDARGRIRTMEMDLTVIENIQ